MALKYSPYPVKDAKIPKNKWFLGISWMSGDADHYEKVSYKFNSEEEFLKAIAVFEKVMEWSPGEHTRKIQDALYNELKIEVEWDITNDQFCADPRFDEHHYFDADGVKKLVEIV
jgi:hypothetical protein